MQESTKLLLDRIRGRRMVEIFGMAYGLALDSYDLGGNAYDRSPLRNFGKYNRIGADHYVVTDLKGA